MHIVLPPSIEDASLHLDAAFAAVQRSIGEAPRGHAVKLGAALAKISEAAYEIRSCGKVLSLWNDERPTAAEPAAPAAPAATVAT